MIFDASRGVLVNLGIRVRDQVKCPVAGDAKAILRQLKEEGGAMCDGEEEGGKTKLVLRWDASTVA